MYVSVCVTRLYMCVPSNYMHALSSTVIVSLTCAHLCVSEEREWKEGRGVAQKESSRSVREAKIWRKFKGTRRL